MLIQEIEIRKVQLSDLDEIYKIEQENFIHCWSKEFIQFNIQLPEYIRKFYVAVKENKIVGYIVCWLSDKTAHIYNISVKKEVQNLGIGRCLLEYLLEELQKYGFKTVVLEVRKSNSKAINLYKKFGFAEVKVLPKFYPDGEDAIFMIKNL
jgi:ribosomal-protein-alanine N-acetyltransferase